MQLRRAAVLFGLLLCAFAPTGYASTAVPGGVYTASLPAGASDVTFDGNPVLQINGRIVVGIPLKQAIGPAHINYMIDGAAQTHTFLVEDKTYTEQHLTIKNQNLVDPPAETLARIRDEAVRQRRLYRSHTEPADLSRGFIKPLEGITTSLFGHRRFFNGQPRNPHSGLDIAGDTGTPIAAAGNGVVKLAEELYFNGNTLFIDHGQGLITMYCHMSELLVGVGDEITQGQTIGLVGATGRVTGPHLHWSVSLNGNRVDPTSFMQALNSIVGTGTGEAR